MIHFFQLEQFIHELFKNPKESLDFLYSSNFKNESSENKRLIKKLRSDIKKVNRLLKKENTDPSHLFYKSISVLIKLHEAINHKGISHLTIFSPMQRFEVVISASSYDNNDLLNYLYEELCYPARCSFKESMIKQKVVNYDLFLNYNKILDILNGTKIPEESINFLKTITEKKEL